MSYYQSERAMIKKWAWSSQYIRLTWYDAVGHDEPELRDKVLFFTGPPCRTLEDMSEAEIVALEKKYGSPVIRPRAEG